MTNKAQCTRSNKEKIITVHENHEAIRRHREKIASKEARELLKLRGSVVEKVLSYHKISLGLWRIIGYGKDNAKAGWYLACALYNIKKIYTVRGMRTVFT